MRKFSVILDPAHGEETPGKRSPDGRFREYKWSRSIIAMIKSGLEKAGFKVVLSNTTNREIGLSARAMVANRVPGKKIFISMHANASANSGWGKARGFSVWTTKGQNNSDKIATEVFNQLSKDFPYIRSLKEMSDGDYDFEANFTVIHKANMPAILVEWLFQDNKDDVEILLSEDTNKKLSESIVRAVENIEKKGII